MHFFDSIEVNNLTRYKYHDEKNLVQTQKKAEKQRLCVY